VQLFFPERKVQNYSFRKEKCKIIISGKKSAKLILSGKKSAIILSGKVQPEKVQINSFRKRATGKSAN
jgi:hypothetical protein